MTHDIALSAFSSSSIPEEAHKRMQEKLEAALKFLGDKHVLAKQVKRLKKKRVY